MSDESKYRHVVDAVRRTPWAIEPTKLAVILDLVAFRAGGGKLTDEEIRDRLDAAGPSRRPGYGSTTSGGAVAVIPIYGVIMPRATLVSQYSGGTSLEVFQDAFQMAIADPEIGAVLFDVDSPGGSVDLVPETAALIRDARGAKPIVAIANTFAASAAYWLACQADELVVTPSGEIGSIGVFAAHQDISRAQEILGVKTTLISAGKYKVEANPYEPLSPEAEQAIQGAVDTFYDMFVADVAAGRGVKEAAVRSGFGEGRVVTAADAVAGGMADRIDTYDATVAQLLRDANAGNSKSAAVDTPALASSLAEMTQTLRQATETRTEDELAQLTRALRHTTQTSPERNQ